MAGMDSSTVSAEKFDPSRAAEYDAQVRIALAASAGREIKLERNRLAHGGGGRFNCGLRQRCAPEIAVQHDTGEIEDRPQG